jgi:AcrR family transcriptional regulator
MSPRVPDIRARLSEVALALYEEQGFAGTTVAAIAAQAGVTERTYFRHFPDKREVLFANESALRDAIAAAVEAAPSSASGLRAAQAGLDAVARQLQPRRAELQRRELVVTTSGELRERELTKLASWKQTFEDSLLHRGVPAPRAMLLAEIAMGALAVAVRRWMPSTGPRTLDEHVGDVLDELRTEVGDPQVAT